MTAKAISDTLLRMVCYIVWMVGLVWTFENIMCAWATDPGPAQDQYVQNMIGCFVVTITAAWMHRHLNKIRLSKS